MEAKKYWTPNLIDWKEFYWQCRTFLSEKAEDSLTAEEFEEFSSNHIDPMDLLESQRGDFYHPDLLAPKELETIRSKCYKIYDDCYEDEKQDCKENYDWFN